MNWYTAIRYVKVLRLSRAYPLSPVNEVKIIEFNFYLNPLTIDDVTSYICMVIVVFVYATMEYNVLFCQLLSLLTDGNNHLSLCLIK